MNTRAALKYLTALLLFGSNGIVASRIALDSSAIVFTRTLIGALFLGVIFVASRQPLRFWRNQRHSFYLTVSGVAMGASWMFLFAAYRQIGVSIATLAYYCGPVIVMVVSQVLFKEKITAVRAIGFGAVVLGMVLVNRQALLQGQVSAGLGLAILSAVMYAVIVIFNKKATSISGLENPMWQLVVSFVTVAVVVGWKQGLSFPIGTGNLVPILILGIVNTGVGCYFYFSAIGDLPVQTVAICGYLEPLSALLFSAAFLGESLGVLQLVGAALILGGAAFGELRRRQPGVVVAKEGSAG